MTMMGTASLNAMTAPPLVGGSELIGSECGSVQVGEDCDDTNRDVYPNAPELCDGRFNDCSNAAYVGTGAPSTEVDDDGDGYVECSDGEYVDINGCVCSNVTESSGVFTYADCVDTNGAACTPNDGLASDTMTEVTWSGGSISGYDDCDDNLATRYPSAPDYL